MRSYIILCFLLLLASCGKSPEQETAEAIDIALTYLSDGDCDDAIDVLEDVGMQKKNPVYLQVLASAFACRADFNEVRFISTDIPTLNTTTAQTMFKSISILTLSPETAADSDEYQDMERAMNVLLNPNDAAKPSQAARNTYYGTGNAGDMGVQLLFLSVTQFGKFLNHYGNVDTTGQKGLGGGASTCFIDYTDPRAQAVIAANQGGACVTNNGGHADLDFAAANLATAKRRVCEGIVIFNNIVDILDNMDLSSNESLSKFTAVKTLVTLIKAPAAAAGLGTILALTSQSDCETAMNDATQFNNMEYFYSLVFESGLQ